MHDFSSLSTRTVEVGESLSSRRGLHGEMLSQEQNKSCLKSRTKNVFYIGMCPLLFYIDLYQHPRSERREKGGR